MGDAFVQPLPSPAALPCAACGYDIASITPGQVCPECGAPIFGFEAAEARALHLRGLTFILWGLPATLLACLLGYVVYLVGGYGEGRFGPTSVQRAGIALSVIPALLTLVGLWLATAPAAGIRGSRGLRRVIFLTILLATVLGAHRLVGHISANTSIGTATTQFGFTYVMSSLSPNWIRTYALGALAGAAAILAPFWAAWLVRASIAAGLMPRSRREASAAIFAAASILMAFVLPPLIDWISRKTIPALASSANLQPTVFAKGRAGQPPIVTPPWHAHWFNPDSAVLLAVVGYTMVIMLGLWLWLATLRLRERTRLLAAAKHSNSTLTSAS